MGRKTIEFDRETLVKAIGLAEEKETFTSLDSMFSKAIVEYSNLGGPWADRLTNILVYNRVKQWGVALKTAPGKKGRAAGMKVERKPRSTIVSLSDQASYAAIRADIKCSKLPAATEVRMLDLVTKVEGGSLRARLRLQCMSCASYQKEEVAHCACIECPLFTSRPYKKG